MKELKELQKWLKSLGKSYTISELNNLEVLSLYDNNLTTIPDEIGKLKNLKYLDIRNSNLVYCNISLDHIKYLYTANTTLIPHTELTEILYGIDTQDYM